MENKITTEDLKEVFNNLIERINSGEKTKEDVKRDTIFVINLKKNAYLISCMGKEDVELSKNRKHGKYGCVWERSSELEELLEEYESVELGNEYGRVELRDYLANLNWLEKEIWNRKKSEKEGK